MTIENETVTNETVTNEKVDKPVEVEKQTTALTASTAFQEDAGSGLENMTAEDFTIPRLKILQALSPEVNKIDGKYIENAASGDIVNPVTKELYTEESGGCLVLPVGYKRMFLEWQPRETGGGLVHQHLDASILSKTTKDKTGADILENGNYIQTSATHYVLLIDGDSFQQVMITMAGTQLKKSRTWNSVMASVKVKSSDGRIFTPPTYSHKYKLTTVAESNDRGTWFGWNIELVGALGDEEMFLYEAAKHFSKNINFESSVAPADSEAPF